MWTEVWFSKDCYLSGPDFAPAERNVYSLKQKNKSRSGGATCGQRFGSAKIAISQARICSSGAKCQ